MESLKITGGRPLNGRVQIDGAKNAALPIMAAALLIDGPSTLGNVPRLVDVHTMTRLLTSLGAEVHQRDQVLQIDCRQADQQFADYEIVRRMRAGICVLGPLLARNGKATVSLPGGCAIGHRPIDLHLKGLAALGADVRLERGYVVAEASRLQGAEINLLGPAGTTVTGTCNVLSAACLAKGRTVIKAAAKEPEVCDLAKFLRAAGASIFGDGTDVIEVEGVDELHPATHDVIPDRIEAATYAIAAAATRGRVEIAPVDFQHLAAVFDTLSNLGVSLTQTADGVCVEATRELNPVDVLASPFPGFPTDCQAQLMALLTTISGSSRVQDDVFSERFMHVSELLRMGAKIDLEPGVATVHGGHALVGADVMASDLRALSLIHI